MASRATLGSDRRETRLPIEAIEKTVDILVIERQRLRESSPSRDVLEANRRAILYWQHELALARHAGPRGRPR
jgi:hypothetical protein